MVQKDLTVGDPKKVLWRFCLPLLGSIIFQQLYNVADSFVAGRFLGEKAIAAVGNGYEITLIFLAFAFGCNIGCSETAGIEGLVGESKERFTRTAGAAGGRKAAERGIRAVRRHPGQSVY